MQIICVKNIYPSYNSFRIIMESTNQDDDSPIESRDNAPNESSANVDFKCEDDNQKTISSSLGLIVEQLKSIADTGIVDIDWPALREALKDRLEEVLESYLEKNPDCKEEQYQEPNVGKFNLEYSKDEILELIASFNEAPFTIQRICELLYSPFKYYDKTSTFLRGLEKNLRVISSNDWPKSPDNTVAPEVENNCTSKNTSQAPPEQSLQQQYHHHHQQQQHNQQQQHEDMNQCEDEPPVLEPPPAAPETQMEPPPSSSLSSPSSSLPSPIKEVTS